MEMSKNWFNGQPYDGQLDELMVFRQVWVLFSIEEVIRTNLGVFCVFLHVGAVNRLR